MRRFTIGLWRPDIELHVMVATAVMALIVAAVSIAAVRSLCAPSVAVLFETLRRLPSVGHMSAAIDQISIQGNVVRHEKRMPLKLRPLQSFEIRGYAFDQRATLPAAGVFFVFDDGRTIRAFYGDDRSGQVPAFHSVTLARTGFHVVVTTQMLSPGTHVLHMRVVAADLSGYSEPIAPLVILVR